jgi:hypothetical protein
MKIGKVIAKNPYVDNGHIPSAATYGVYIFQLMQYFRAWVFSIVINTAIVTDGTYEP